MRSRTKTTLLFLSAFLLAIPATLADDHKKAEKAEFTDSHVAAIEKLFEVTKQKEQYEIATIAGFEAGLGSAADQMPPFMRPKFEKAMKKVQKFMLTEMSFEKMKPAMIQLYAKEFTEKEIRDVLPLLEDEKYQRFAAKQLIILPKASKLGADKAQELQPAIMKMVQEEMSK